MGKKDRVYELEEQIIFTSQDVVFLEDVYPFIQKDCVPKPPTSNIRKETEWRPIFDDEKG